MIDTALIRASTDLVALISKTVKLKRMGKDWYGRCPFHVEKSASFSVVPAKRFYHCHGCGAHGDALDFVMQTEGVTLREAAARLGGAEASPAIRRRLAAEQAARDCAIALRAQRDAEISEFYDRHPVSPVPDWALDV